MATTPLQAITTPDPSDGPDGPAQILAVATALESRTVMRFASTSARDLQITSPVEGMVAATGSDTSLIVWIYRGSGWERLWQAGPTWAGLSFQPNWGADGTLPPQSAPYPDHIVRLHGRINRTGTTFTGAPGSVAQTASTPPATARAFTAASSNGPVVLTVGTNGAIAVTTSGTWTQNVSWIQVDGVFWEV